jgi:hypothetical protein
VPLSTGIDSVLGTFIASVFALSRPVTIERHNSDTINYCLNGKVFYTSATKSTAELYFIAIFYDAYAQANCILMNYDICSDLTIKFNKDATEVAVEAVVKAVSYQGTAKTVGLSVTNNTGLESAKTLAIKVPSTLSIPVLSGTIPRVHLNAYTPLSFFD